MPNEVFAHVPVSHVSTVQLRPSPKSKQKQSTHCTRHEHGEAATQKPRPSQPEPNEPTLQAAAVASGSPPLAPLAVPPSLPLPFPMAASPSLHATRLLPLLPNPAPSLARPRRRLTAASAVPPSRNGSSAGTDWCPVPPEQRPVNEYEALAASQPFSWAAGDLRLYCSRLAFTGAAFALFVGLPVAAFGGRGGAGGDALHLALGATGSGILAVTLAVVRMYLGWAYVGNRLLSATVEYEETGWYDGQIWVKTPEVLARDRLLGSFSVKPVLNRVKFTLVGLAVSLTLCILLYANTEKPREPLENPAGGRAIPGVYSDAAARSFEPDAFCGEPDLGDQSEL
ncbi:hypothetical protein ACQJBY_040845 [Aegilops geniculata]